MHKVDSEGFRTRIGAAWAHTDGKGFDIHENVPAGEVMPVIRVAIS